MNKKELRAYRQNIKQHRKILTKLVKEASPYDYGFGLDLFVQFLKFMQDYYEEGINVHALEVEGYAPRLESITQALDEYEKYLEYEQGLPSSWEILRSDGTHMFAHADYSIEALDEHNRKTEEHWNNFWNIIRDNMLTWWD